MSLSVAELMIEIEKLSQNQRQELRTWLLVSQSLGKEDITTDERMAADVICRSMDAMAAGKLHLAQLQRHNGWKAFAEKVPLVFQFVRDGGCSQRIELLTMLNLGVRFLYLDLVRGGYSATPYTIMAQFHRVPAMINKQFPGYAKCKLLGMIVHSKLKEGSSV